MCQCGTWSVPQTKLWVTLLYYTRVQLFVCEGHYVCMYALSTLLHMYVWALINYRLYNRWHVRRCTYLASMFINLQAESSKHCHHFVQNLNTCIYINKKPLIQYVILHQLLSWVVMGAVGLWRRTALAYGGRYCTLWSVRISSNSVACSKWPAYTNTRKRPWLNGAAWQIL